MTRTLHTASVVLPISAAPIRDGGVLVEDGRILAVGDADDLSDGVEVREWTGVLMPGFVNAHAHTEYGPSFNDLATSGLPFPLWMLELVKRWETHTEADWLADARGSVEQMLATGTTCVSDIVTIGPGVTAAAEVGMAGISYLEIVARDDAGWPETRVALEEMLASAPSARMVGISPHTLYTISLGVFGRAMELARSRGLRLHPHLAETADELDFVATGTGPLADTWGGSGLAFELLAEGGRGITPAALLEQLGGLDTDTHVAHGVHLDHDDRARLRARGVAVALCTRSNAILGAGEAPVRAYLEEGSPIGVGTDSLSSCPSLDMLAELQALRALAVRQGIAADGLDARLLAAATLGGAKAMGLADAGSLHPGARADLVVVDADPSRAESSVVAEGKVQATVLLGEVVAGG